MLTVGDLQDAALRDLLARYGMQLRVVRSDAPIQGSYWGECEAGLVGASLIVRHDTPLHSALHEASHFICLDDIRRAQLVRDAGGDHAEENAVCYLQILLADRFSQRGSERMMSDMDAWGYTFRLGSARAWFEQDAGDARQWLWNHGIIDAEGEVTWKVRDQRA